MLHKIDDTTLPESELTASLTSLVTAAKVTGLSVTLFNAGALVYQRCFGVADIATKAPLRPDHLFYGASLSKAVFGYLVAGLVLEGRLSLDRPLQDYVAIPIPELPFAKSWRGFQDLVEDTRYTQITARMCLNHTAGFQNWRWLTADGPDMTQRLRISFEPGTQYQYSGEGLQLLQRVIEEIIGEGLEALARRWVFDPLGMTMTSYLWQDHFEDRYCLGHTADQQSLPKKKRKRAMAAGSLETTPEDYASFFGHVLRLAADKDPLTRLLFTPSFRIRTKQQFGPEAKVICDDNDPIQLSYGLGWGLLQTPYGPGAFKEGHGDGFQHHTVLFPQTGTGIMLLANSDNAGSLFQEGLALAVGDVYTPWYWEGY